MLIFAKVYSAQLIVIPSNKGLGRIVQEPTRRVYYKRKVFCKKTQQNTTYERISFISRWLHVPLGRIIFIYIYVMITLTLFLVNMLGERIQKKVPNG